MLLDLNARRAARAAKRGEDFVVSVGDPAESFRLVEELPLRAMELIGEGELVAAVKMLVVDPAQWERFAELVSLDDVADISSLYGSSLGESSASTESSADAGEPSGQTSNATTDSISLNVATDPPPSA